MSSKHSSGSGYLSNSNSNSPADTPPVPRQRSETVSATTSPRGEKKLTFNVTDKSKRSLRRNQSESAIPDGPERADLEYDLIHISARSGNLEGNNDCKFTL